MGNAFVFSIKKWNEALDAIGILSKSGRYGGGIYAHVDIALEFASWLSPEFKLYIIKDYKRLKNDENSRFSLNWNLNLILPELTPEQISCTYANEADMLNVALFGQTAKQWREVHPKSKGNIRDEATVQQLLVLANMESYNAVLIEQGKHQSERLKLLREFALKQLETLNAVSMDNLPLLNKKEK